MPRHQLVVVIALVGMLYSASSVKSQTLPSLFSGTGHWYQVILAPSPASWIACRDSAVSLGGYLATIHSGAEDDFIASIIPSSPADAWIGAFEATEGNWTWVSGEPWGYQDWCSGQPDNVSGIEDFISVGNGTGSPACWNDRSLEVGTALWFVVEYDIIAFSASRLSENGHWYQVFLPSLMTWTQSREFSANMGGHMATIQSQSENDFIRALLADSIDGAFLGGHEVSVEGDWQWVSGEAWMYSNWDVGEPNNSNENEDALGMWGPTAIGGEPGTWNDFARNQFYGNPYEFGFVVEFDCYPSPQTCTFDASDTNCDGILDILDVVQAVTRVFRNGPPLSPCCPFQ